MDRGTVLVVAVAAAVVVTLVVAVALLVRLVRARRVLRDAGVGGDQRVLFWVALVYAISPVDLLPDPILLDDIGLLLYAVHSLSAAAREHTGSLRLRGVGKPGKPGEAGPRRAPVSEFERYE
ncbi:YkvA family protein [Streptomyces sp. LP05-1]|uniref:YkvA family protein n=1 Tax=Streptomyces pyxinae TaxID=2970734 RepID=A0ABT2CCB7_9ACTN|nr:YkvA family protein [Streptomyces sp. LP05-1]MCS0635062.1 YkvA family protein [Streptomyces sp. LP05-1]